MKTILRYLVGLVLFTTAIGKLLDNRGFAEVLSHYQTFPAWTLLGFALAISLAELFLSIWLFLGRKLHLAAWAALVMHFAYMVWSGLSVLRGLQIDNCGCFGVFLARPLGWSTVVEDAVMVILCAVLVYQSKTGD